MNFQKELNEIISIIKEINPELIFLFGSCASGYRDEQSDIDLIIVAPHHYR
jgi:predicted nucleotidyltransferase